MKSSTSFCTRSYVVAMVMILVISITHQNETALEEIVNNESYLPLHVVFFYPTSVQSLHLLSVQVKLYN